MIWTVPKESLLSRVTPRSLTWSEIATIAPATLTVDIFGRERARWEVPRMIASVLSGPRAMPLLQNQIRSTDKHCSSWFKA